MDYDDAYANAPYIDGAEDYPPRWQAASAQWAATATRKTVSYGAGDRQALDLFYPATHARGLVVFVHGGYWLKFHRHYWFHLAQGALARGWAVAMPSYDLCPDVRISEITEQIAQAVTTASAQVDGPLILTGHSAGGHLVARMMAPGKLPAPVADRVQHVMPISPVSDLRPLMHTAMNAELRIDAEEAATESPVLMEDRLEVPVTVWVGGDERPAFLDQARWLAEAWQAKHVVDKGKHHFDVIDGLMDADSPMITALLCQSVSP